MAVQLQVYFSLESRMRGEARMRAESKAHNVSVFRFIKQLFIVNQIESQQKITFLKQNIYTRNQGVKYDTPGTPSALKKQIMLCQKGKHIKSINVQKGRQVIIYGSKLSNLLGFKYQKIYKYYFMTFYEFTSTLLTIIGYSTLVYRIIFDLQSGKVKKNRQEKLCTKWLIFTIFLKVQFYILAIIQILPFGSLLMLVFKLFLFLPQNAISHQIYKRIQKYLQRVKLQQYNSHFSIVLSFLCTYTVIFLMKIICKIAALIDSKHIDQVETQNKEIIKILQYKKAAINMRYQVAVSQVNKELNSSEFNNSVIQEPLEMGSKIIQRTQIGREMSKILVDLDQADPSQHISMKAEQMIIKPNKELGTKAKYENVQVEYFLKTSKITFINKHKAVQSKTLKEVRWITKNMMNIEMVFRQGGSKIIKLKDNIHVVTFVEPICTNLLNIKQQLI